MKLKNTKTEGEAVLLFCPPENQTESDGTPARRRNTFCVGSRCNWWRWLLTAENEAKDEPEGYCGAAGPP